MKCYFCKVPFEEGEGITKLDNENYMCNNCLEIQLRNNKAFINYKEKEMDDYRNAQCMPVAAERDTPEVRRALSNLDDVVCRYDHLVGRLADRLSCITVPAPPVGTTNKEEQGYQTSLANEIDIYRIRLKNITNDLESIYERLEV